MADEDKGKGKETPPADPPKQEDQAAVALNEATVAAIAKQVHSMTEAEVVALFGKHLGEHIGNAQKEMEKSNAVKLAAEVEASKLATGGKVEMTRDMAAEELRCKLARLCGRPDLAVPKADLDVGGMVTQALTPITGSAGAYTMPDTFIAELEKRAGQPVVVWPLLNKEAVKTRTVKKPAVTTYITVNRGSSANVNNATSTTLITETVPVFTEIEWNLEDFDARMPVKLDLLEESALNLYDELMALCADAYAVEHERMPIIGQGHGHQEPEGLQMGVSGITAVPVGAAPTVANVLDFVAEIPQRYRGNAKLVMNADTKFEIAAVLAQNVRSAQYLAGLLPEMLESEYVAEGKIIGGDFSRYHVKYIRLLQVVTSIAAERKTQEIVVTETWTGKVVQTDAFRIATGITYG